MPRSQSRLSRLARLGAEDEQDTPTDQMQRMRSVYDLDSEAPLERGIGPMDMPFVLPLLIAVAIFAFYCGRQVTKFPSEEAMFERLVRLRADRKIEASTRKTVDDQIEAAAERAVS